MLLDEIRAKLAEHHLGVPQRAMLAHLALNDVEAGLARLASLGHAFHLEGASPPPVLLWPKMLYRDGFPSMTVENRGDFESALGDGWREHPTDPSAQIGPRPNGEAAPASNVLVFSDPTQHPDMPLGGLTGPAVATEPSEINEGYVIPPVISNV